MALLISMMASRVLRKNAFLGNVENLFVNWTRYSLFRRLRLSSKVAQLGLGSVSMFCGSMS
jgi:hypothetical protein